MRRITNNSVKLIALCVLVIAPVIWLSLSFWNDAFQQRKNAVQLQDSLHVEDSLFLLASKISAERSAFYSIFSSSDTNSDNSTRWFSVVNSTDKQYSSTIEDIEQLRNDSILDSNFRYSTQAFQKKLQHLTDFRQRLDVYRQYISEQAALPKGSRDRSMQGYLFDFYGDYMESANDLRRGTFYLSRKYDKNMLFSAELKNTTWALSDASSQIDSLLHAFGTSASEDTRNSWELSGVIPKVSNQQKRVELALVEIVQVGEAGDIDVDLVQKSRYLNKWYRSSYRNLITKMQNAMKSGAPASISAETWESVSEEFSTRANELNEIASLKSSESASSFKRKANIELLVDTLVVLLGLVMGATILVILRRIHHQAYHDDLTNLPGRRRFEELLDQTIRKVKTDTDQVVLMAIDLDGFKTINDTMGHAIGDKLLKLVSERLLSLNCQQYSVARMGGDEFSVLYTASSEIDPLEFGEEIQSTLANPYSIDDGSVHIGASIGYSLYPSQAKSAIELQINSDLAMFSAKQAGRNCIKEFDAELSIEFQHRLHTEQDLQNAIEGDQFELYYQPQYNLALKRVDAVEALIRWNHPVRGFVSPAEFISVAEDSGLMPEIGTWVLNEACKQSAEWAAIDGDPIRVAVNVSVQQIMQPDFVDTVLNAMEQNNLDASLLEIEVTESVVTANVEWVVQCLLSLREMGIKIALDDFGTGYSSLSQLQDLPVNTLKIDRSFISKLESEASSSNAVAETIAALAKAFAMETVAEGVETQLQHSQLCDLGIDVIQGYYYSKPVEHSQVLATISTINEQAGVIKKAA